VIQNRRHVTGIRDLIHASIQQYAKDMGTGPGGIAGADAVTAIAWVLRDMIKEAPDAQTRASLAAGARYAIDEAGKMQVIMPPGHA
jgi:hypothetical protein